MNNTLDIKSIESYILSLDINCIKNVTYGKYRIDEHKYFTFEIKREPTCGLNSHVSYKTTVTYKPTHRIVQVNATPREKESLYGTINKMFVLEHNELLKKEIKDFSKTFNIL